MFLNSPPPTFLFAVDMPKQTLDLRDKQHPSEELPKAITRDWYLHYTTPQNKLACFNAGQALLNKMKSLMKVKHQDGLGDLPDSLGDCGLKRAFHDELGVRKVVFKFSDDVLSTVYTLESNWQLFEPELVTIFKTAGVNPQRVIRCLLAEMSSEVTIPVHHDTGYWATRSHRVHVPIITQEDLVEFYTGKTEQTLLRVPFPQFHVIELNNRAKHSVVNGWDKPRVHLIFDFCEEHEPVVKQVWLKPTDVVYQTRRTISINSPVPVVLEEEKIETVDRQKLVKVLLDRIQLAHSQDKELGQRMIQLFVKLSKRYAEGELLAQDYCKFLRECFLGETSGAALDITRLLMDRERARVLRDELTQPVSSSLLVPPSKATTMPFFVIAGVMKCGTTSLFEYINCHPLCIRARQKEPHAFDWVWNQLQMLPGDTLSQKYSNAFPEVPTDKFTGEATPSYILGGAEVLKRLVAGAPEHRALKVIIILRDPVERAWSHYRMTADVEGLTQDQLARRGNVQGLTFSQLVERDLDLLAQCQVDAGRTIAEEFESAYLSGLPAGHGAHSYVGRGLYALQFELLFKVLSRDQVLVLKLEDVESHLQREMDRVFDFLGVARVEVNKIKEERFNVSKLKVEKSAEDLKALEKLRGYYQPHNARMAKLLPEITY
ncbi:hypothetical protein BASA81_003063 [Batrachochytrium salamandrivorans]|nr:hypothetical protein BASA81_003063 [Batrachochytrium salamandrivorans]